MKLEEVKLSIKEKVGVTFATLNDILPFKYLIFPVIAFVSGIHDGITGRFTTPHVALIILWGTLWCLLGFVFNLIAFDVIPLIVKDLREAFLERYSLHEKLAKKQALDKVDDQLLK